MSLKDIPANYCPLCNLEEELLIDKGKYWSLVLPKAPYWKYHIMLVPHRHIVDYAELEVEEFEEFKRYYSFIVEKFKKSDLKYTDGSSIKQLLFFWRIREDEYDEYIKTNKISHFHFHITPEKPHSWDSIMDKDAYKVDTHSVIRIFKDKTGITKS